jgi:predicted Zn-dependent protease
MTNSLIIDDLRSEGNNEYPVKEVMVVAGNIFDALYDLVGISKERKVLADSILPYMLFDNILLLRVEVKDKW